MRKILVSVAAAIAMTAVSALAGEPACPAGPAVPGSAFREGTVDGRWLGVVLNEVGGNGGALSATLYTLDQYDALAQLGPVRAAGAGGDRMDADFIDGKLYLTNEIFTNAEAHCCPSHLVAQRFGIHKGKPPDVALEREGAAIIATPRVAYTEFEKKCDSASAEHFDKELRAELTAANYVQK